VLIVHLFNGDDVKGTVDGDTEIECEHAQQTTTAARTADDGGGDDHGDDNEGDDDHGGQGDDDQGDDDNEDEDQSGCDASALTQGAIVGEAELKATAAGLVFREIELVV
jgi:hypothetical protein